MEKIRVIVAIFCVMGLLGAGGCDQQQVSPQVSQSGAAQITDISKVPLNANGFTAEQQNIIDRIGVTTDPTKVLWVHLIALDGKIIQRMPVRMKVTSSGKRLEPRHAGIEGQSDRLPRTANGYRTDELIQPDGTYGDSDPYIFWFDTLGRYHQWGTAGGLGYLLTDYPIDLQNPQDAITGLYKVHQAAFDWQKVQEKELREKEQQSRNQAQPQAVPAIVAPVSTQQK
jgi:hypothetical protein